MKQRTLEEVKQDYANLCAKAGNTQYQISVLKSELELVNEQLKDLNLEGASIEKARAEEGVVS